MKKYVIFLTCLCAVALVLGFSTNMSYANFVEAGDFLSNGEYSVNSELLYFRKAAAWLSVYEIDAEIILDPREDQNMGDWDYFILFEDDDDGLPTRIYLYIGKEAYDYGIGEQFEVIGSLLDHGSIVLDPGTTDLTAVEVLLLILNYILFVIYLLEFLTAVLVIIVFFVVNIILLVFNLILVLFYLAGFTQSLYG